MILYELVGQEEQNPIYQKLSLSNYLRQLGFLESLVVTALDAQRPFLSQTVIKALNYHAIACLHAHAGEYRPCAVEVGSYRPPEDYRVAALMDDFVNDVNRHWESANPIALSAYVLWRLNWIHPFINGNGRTARAVCYFVLCLKIGGWVSGAVVLPELLRRERQRCIEALREADSSGDTTDLQELIVELLDRQRRS